MRRQAAIIEIRNKLAEANTVEQSGSLTAAAILYEDAQKGIESNGLTANGIGVERAGALEGLPQPCWRQSDIASMTSGAGWVVALLSRLSDIERGRYRGR